MSRLKTLALFCSVAAQVYAAAIVISASGTDTVSTTAARDAFRTTLGGGTTAGANGSFGGLRREINWDGVPGTLSAPNNLPADFFNVNSPRGVVFSTPGTGFQVSGASTDSVPLNFGNIDPSYTATFAPFSPQRLFTALGSNVVDVNFFLAGTSTAGTVSGFGAVFSDVDLANTTSIQFFDASNFSLGTFFVPNVSGSQTFSFLGVSFNAGERIRRVRITSGNVALGAGVTDQNGNTRDLVVMDDFLYSEPTGIPEPATILSALAGFGLLALIRRTK
ncbi:MAG TPA: hypothetical protein VMZ52_07115 [Bryobacteraceae bacterium]|nr:hypothetical protein [Bryobacteraceae bacterium]